jgi:heterodisulfide reductase subunit A
LGGKVVAAESIAMRLGDPDECGRRRPLPVPGSEELVAVDLVIVAIGLDPDTSPFADELETGRNRVLAADGDTLQTSMRGVFAGGDAVTGPASIVEAVGQGKRAARQISALLNGDALPGDGPVPALPVMDAAAVLRRHPLPSHRVPIPAPALARGERIRGFTEVEGALTEREARHAASRCLDCGGCSECHECIHACPADAIDLDANPTEEFVEAESVILSTGFELFDPGRKDCYGYGRFPNVITGMQMDRILSPTRPYNRVLRPSDGKVPERIAFVLCTGSRDRTVDNRLCSRVCCMYSIKQAQLLMGALPLADITLYFIDIRAFGKGYEEFYRQTEAMGANFVEGRVARIEETEDSDLIVHYEDVAGCGCLQKAEHDLVVLSVGLLPNRDPLGLFKGGILAPDAVGFVAEVDEDLDPGRTSVDGVFVAGSGAAVRDIPDTILHAGAVAAQAAAYVERRRTSAG